MNGRILDVLEEVPTPVRDRDLALDCEGPKWAFICISHHRGSRAEKESEPKRAPPREEPHKTLRVRNACIFSPLTASDKDDLWP
jgi:hypothetical protein